MEQYAGEWVSTYKAGIATKSYNTYVRHLRALCNECGAKKLKDVVASDIQRVYNTRIGMSKSENSKLRLAVNGMFEAAVTDRLISFNPCAKVTMSPRKAGTHRAIEPFERALIEQMAQTDHRLAAGAMVMLYAGLRRGEACAINIDRDIDFTAETITVNEAVRFEKNRPIVCDPKTEAGMRTIPLAAPLVALLKDKHGLLISAPNGAHISETGFKGLWRSFLGNAGVLHNGGRRKRWVGKTKEDKAVIDQGGKVAPWAPVSIQPHDLRHSFCTMLYDLDVDLKTAMLWMGHADQAMTLRIYTHLSAKRENSSTKKFRKGFGSQNGSQPPK